MSNIFDARNENAIPITSGLALALRPVMRMVYVWMTLGLVLTGIVAVTVAGSPTLIRAAMSNGLFIGAIVIELVLVLALSAAINRMSPAVAAIMFFAYAALNGFTLSLIFVAYDIGAIYKAFFSAAITFAVMSVVGFTTEFDLSRYRSYFVMGLIGLVVASVVNIFLRSSGFDLIISLFGVGLFVALTAYDTQKIAQLAARQDIEADGTVATRVSIIGALTLYLDFINLFLFLLRLFGRQR